MLLICYLVAVYSTLGRIALNAGMLAFVDSSTFDPASAMNLPVHLLSSLCSSPTTPRSFVMPYTTMCASCGFYCKHHSEPHKTVAGLSIYNDRTNPAGATTNFERSISVDRQALTATDASLKQCSNSLRRQTQRRKYSGRIQRWLGQS